MKANIKIRNVDLVIANSQAVYENCKAAKLDLDIVTLVNNPIIFPEINDLDLNLSVGIQKPFILFVGQILPRKSPFELLEAFDRLQKHVFKSHKLVFIGRNMMGGQFLDAVNERPYVHYLGEMTRNECCAYMYAADIVAVPSKIEGIPRVALEAISLEKSFIAPMCARI